MNEIECILLGFHHYVWEFNGVYDIEPEDYLPNSPTFLFNGKQLMDFYSSLKEKQKEKKR